QIRTRVECKEARALRAPRALRNLIPGKGSEVVKWVFELCAQSAEIAGPECIGRHKGQAGYSVAAVLILPPDVEEGLVAPDASAERRTVLVANQRELAR